MFAHAPPLDVLILAHTEDADRAIQAAVREVRSAGVRPVWSVAAAEAAVAAGDVAVLIVHVRRDGKVGELTRLVQTAAKAVGVLVVGDPDCGDIGLDLLRAGATDYLERPLDIRRLALQTDLLLARPRPAPDSLDPRPETPTPAERGPTPLADVMGQVYRVAGVDTTVLLLGETGTGKTRLARVVHDHSPRSAGPFVVVDCAALSASLIESELFGHVKGAFTGADRDRIGKCAAAAGGTMLLDEVDSLPVELQAKLLRLVEDREFVPVGANRSVRFDARLVAASNKPLDREVAAGRFRADLYHRLNVVGFELPALRDRAADIPALAAQFLAEYAGKANRPIAGFDPAAMACLVGYRWPGNVRELRNVIERAVALRADGVIGLDDLTDAVRAVVAPVAGRGAGLNQAREVAEADRILQALRLHNNNRAKAAAELGVSRMTLYNKLHRYGLIAAR